MTNFAISVPTVITVKMGSKMTTLADDFRGVKKGLWDSVSGKFLPQKRPKKWRFLRKLNKKSLTKWNKLKKPIFGPKTRFGSLFDPPLAKIPLNFDRIFYPLQKKCEKKDRNWTFPPKYRNETGFGIQKNGKKSIFAKFPIFNGILAKVPVKRLRFWKWP